MGNENSQITFPIEPNSNYNKIKINNKKIKYKIISNRPIENKLKNQKNTKVIKGFIVPRISITPDRNVNIKGINKEDLNNKRYGSYEKPLKSNNNDNKNKNNINKKTILNRNRYNEESIIYITNLLNSIYSYEIDKEINDINLINSGTKNINFNSGIKGKSYSKKQGINLMFDAIFNYNYYFNNSNKINKKKSINKNRYNSPYSPESISQSKAINEIKNSRNTNIDNINDIKNVHINNQNNQKNKNNYNNPNTSIILNNYNIENEVISVNNKRHNYDKVLDNYLKTNNKKYSESRFLYESESGFISSEEMSLINNMQKMEKKTKEEDASESQTDYQQEVIKHNLTNKNKVTNNYFIESNINKKATNNYINKNNWDLNIISNINNLEINNNNYNNIKNYDIIINNTNIINNKVNYNDTNKYNNKDYNKQKNNKKSNNNLNNRNIVIGPYENNNDIENEIVLMNNESNKDDENNTYLEILMAMNEKKTDNNNINLNFNNNKYKKINKVSKENENKKHITPPNIHERREIIPLVQEIKREITPKNTTNRMILKTKKITPLRKIPINFYNNINYDSKNNCYNISINTNFSPKEKPLKTSINKSNNNNISSRKIFEKRTINKSNNNSPIITSYGNLYSNIIKSKKNSESPSPSNSPEPSPSNNFNNNYKDRYAYIKKIKANNSIKKSIKINESNNMNSVNANNNIINGNNNIKSSYNKVNNASNIYNINNTNTFNNNTNYTNNISNTNNLTYNNNNTYANNSKRTIRNYGNKNKFIFVKKSGKSYNKLHNNKEITEVEPRTKSNDQKYLVFNSKNVLSSNKKKQK